MTVPKTSLNCGKEAVLTTRVACYTVRLGSFLTRTLGSNEWKVPSDGAAPSFRWEALGPVCRGKKSMKSHRGLPSEPRGDPGARPAVCAPSPRNSSVFHVRCLRDAAPLGSRARTCIPRTGSTSGCRSSSSRPFRGTACPCSDMTAPSRPWSPPWGKGTVSTFLGYPVGKVGKGRWEQPGHSRRGSPPALPVTQCLRQRALGYVLSCVWGQCCLCLSKEEGGGRGERWAGRPSASCPPCGHVGWRGHGEEPDFVGREVYFIFAPKAPRQGLSPAKWTPTRIRVNCVSVSVFMLRPGDQGFWGVFRCVGRAHLLCVETCGNRGF